MTPSVLSRRVLADVFGIDFVTSLESSASPSDGPTAITEESSSSGTATTTTTTEGLENVPRAELDLSAKDMVHPSPAKSHLVKVHHPATQQATTTNNTDGPSKPNKTPRRMTDSPNDIMDFEDISTSFKKE